MKGYVKDVKLPVNKEPLAHYTHPLLGLQHPGTAHAIIEVYDLTQAELWALIDAMAPSPSSPGRPESGMVPLLDIAFRRTDMRDKGHMAWYGAYPDQHAPDDGVEVPTHADRGPAQEREATEDAGADPDAGRDRRSLQDES